MALCPARQAFRFAFEPSNISRSECNALLELADERSFKPGHRLTHEEQSCDSLVLLLEGTLNVTRHGQRVAQGYTQCHAILARPPIRRASAAPLQHSAANRAASAAAARCSGWAR